MVPSIAKHVEFTYVNVTLLNCSLLMFHVLVKKSPSVTTMLHNRFETSPHPYEEALRLMYNCLDFKNAKPKSLAYLIMDEFKIWSSDKNQIRHLLTHDIKLSAFNVVRQQGLFSVMKLVAEIYEFNKNSDIFLNMIKHMIQNKDYKEVREVFCFFFVLQYPFRLFMCL